MSYHDQEPEDRATYYCEEHDTHHDDGCAGCLFDEYADRERGDNGFYSGLVPDDIEF